MYKYSIIVPIYNTEKYIDKCIVSLKNQTYRNIEILLIDDGSKDASYEKCINYAKMDNRIKVKHISNSGVSHARNIGIDLATGDYILFVDSDDYINIQTIEECNRIMINHDIDILRFNYLKKNGFLLRKNKYQIDCDCAISKEEYQDKIYPFLFTTNDISNSCHTIFKREIVDSIRFDEKLNFGEDKKFLIDCINKSNSIYFYKKNLYYYVDNKNSAINNYNEETLCKKFADIADIHLYFFDKYYRNQSQLIKRIKQSRDIFLVELNILNTFNEYQKNIKRILLNPKINQISDKYKMLTNEDLFKECLGKDYFVKVNKIYKKNKIKRMIKNILSS